MRVNDAKSVLDRAEYTDPNNKFVLGCKYYFIKTGVLTPKQLYALWNVKGT